MMARDDYFPTAVGTFEFEVKKSHLQDRRGLSAAEVKREKNGKDDGSRKEPELFQIQMNSASATTGGADKDGTQKVGLVTLRLLGYIHDEKRDKDWKGKSKQDTGD